MNNTQIEFPVSSEKLRAEFGCGRSKWSAIRRAAGIPARARYVQRHVLLRFLNDNPGFRMTEIYPKSIITPLPAREFEAGEKVLDEKQPAKIRVRELIITVLQRFQNLANKNRNLEDSIAATELEMELHESIARLGRGKKGRAGMTCPKSKSP